MFMDPHPSQENTGPHMQSHNPNRKSPRLRQGLYLLCPIGRGWIWSNVQCSKDILNIFSTLQCSPRFWHWESLPADKSAFVSWFFFIPLNTFLDGNKPIPKPLISNKIQSNSLYWKVKTIQIDNLMDIPVYLLLVYNNKYFLAWWIM